MSKKTKVTVTLQLGPQTTAFIDEYIERILHHMPGSNITRTGVVQSLLYMGMAQARKECEMKSPMPEGILK